MAYEIRLFKVYFADIENNTIKLTKEHGEK